MGKSGEMFLNMREQEQANRDNANKPKTGRPTLRDLDNLFTCTESSETIMVRLEVNEDNFLTELANPNGNHSTELDMLYSEVMGLVVPLVNGEHMLTYLGNEYISQRLEIPIFFILDKEDNLIAYSNQFVPAYNKTFPQDYDFTNVDNVTKVMIPIKYLITHQLNK